MAIFAAEDMLLPRSLSSSREDIPGCSPSRHKIAHMKNIPVSQWIGYVGLITSCVFLGLFISSRAVQLIILPKVQGARFKSISYKDQKSVSFHWVAGILKLAMISAFAGPFVSLIFLDGQFDTRFSGNVTMGDIALVSAASLSAIFLWELGYRADHASYFTAAHHIATVIMTQLVLAISAYAYDHREASAYMYMGIIWGIFEVMISLPLDPILIIRRFYLDSHPLLVRNLLAGLTVWSLVGTVTEVIATFWLMGVSWQCWGAGWKGSIIVVFLLWVASQLQTVNAFYNLTIIQHRRMLRMSCAAGAQQGKSDVEMGQGSIQGSTQGSTLGDERTKL